MKIGKEAVILVIVIVVLSLYLFFNKSDRSFYELPDLKPIPASKISKVTIDSPEDSITFIRKAGAWVVNEEAYPGDETSIKSVVDMIGGLSLTALISESKNYERYELDPDHKITIKAWEEGKLVREFDVGKSASGHRHTFVKLAGDDRVYQARDNFRNKVQKKADMFRYKTVMSFNTDQIEQVQVVKKESQSIYKREKAPQSTAETSADDNKKEMDTAKIIWKNAEGEVVAEKKLSKLISDMSSLKCSAFIYDRQKDDFKNPVTSISFLGAEENTLQIFDGHEKDASEYPAVSSQNDYPFFIPKWQADPVIDF